VVQSGHLALSKDLKDKEITIFGKKYLLSDLTDEQITIGNHIKDLENKMSKTAFELDQLTVAREAFIERLKKAFKSKK